MKAKTIYFSICVLGVMLALTLGGGLAQEPDERDEPKGVYAVDGELRDWLKEELEA